MKKINCALFGLFFCLNAFSMECTQMPEPSKTLCHQNANMQIMIANLSAQISMQQTAEAAMTTICTAKCGYGNGVVSSIKEYFSQTPQGVTERLLVACRANLPINFKDRATVSSVECKPI
jgi:hypothetical protein